VTVYHLGTEDFMSPGTVGQAAFLIVNGNSISIEKMWPKAMWTMHIHHCNNEMDNSVCHSVLQTFSSIFFLKNSVLEWNVPFLSCSAHWVLLAL
jgi:hypothetical protein